MANFTNHKNNKPLSKTIVALIRRRNANGQPKVQIARDLGISHSVVRKYTTPKRHLIPQETKDEVLRLLELGETRSEIARHLGVSRGWVSSIAPVKTKAPQRLSQPQKDEIIRRYMNGEKSKKIAQGTGVSTHTVLMIVKKVVQPLEASCIAEIEEKLDDKNSRQVATEMALPHVLVQRVANQKKGADVSAFSEEQKLEMAELVGRGYSFVEVARRFGTSQWAVGSVYKRAVANGAIEPKIALAYEDDRELLRAKRRYPKYETWRVHGVQWFKVVKGHFSVVCKAINDFFLYLEKHSLFENPADFFLKKNAKLIPGFYETMCSKSDHGAAVNNALIDFLDWVLTQPEFADETEEGDLYVSPIFRNPINRVSRLDHKPRRSSESNKKVMPFFMIHDLRRRIVQGPNFQDWNWVQKLPGKMTLSGDKESRDWFEVTEDKIDKLDPDCVWRIRTRLASGSVLELWSPVRWVAVLLKLQTTARMGQIRMLDSGEADTFIYENNKFAVNKSPLAMGTQRLPRRQGVLRESDEKTLTLFFNTNKTADKEKVGAGKGMVCPWPKLLDIADDPYYWIEKLRNWQAKYNPPKEVVDWSSIPQARRLVGKSESDCSDYEPSVFLFRTPESEGLTQYPVSAGVCYKVWQIIITEYQNILFAEGKRDLNGEPIELVADGKSEVTLHGLRVSLITHLILDGGVPPLLMMKIVGHARFIMTIYYTKPGLQRIEDAIEGAAQRLDAMKDESLVRDLKSRSAEQIRNFVAFNTETIADVLPLDPSDRNPLGWLPLHDGICLAGGNTAPINGDDRFPGCHNGGVIFDEVKRAFGPVPGGVRNCTRCRWKCAGKHHALGLQATLNNRQYHLHKASEAAIGAERQRDILLLEKAKTEFAGEPFLKMSELLSNERRYEVAMHRMQELALDLVAVNRMIERIKELPDQDDGPTALVAQADLLTLQSVLKDTDSELLVLSEICADVEFFPDLEAGTAVFEFAQLLDNAFEREGHPILFARMSEQEKLSAANAIMRQLERVANPNNSVLARRRVVEIIDRGESLERALGVSLRDVVQSAPTAVNTVNTLRITERKTKGRDE